MRRKMRRSRRRLRHGYRLDIGGEPTDKKCVGFTQNGTELLHGYRRGIEGESRVVGARW